MVQGDEVYLRTIAGLRKARVLLRRIDEAISQILLELQRPLQKSCRRPRPGRAAGQCHADQRGRLRPGGIPGASRASCPRSPVLCCDETEASQRRHMVVWSAPSARPFSRVSTSWQLPLRSRARARAFPQEDLGRWRKRALDERAAILPAIERRGIDFVGQEAVKLSTTPV